MNASAPQAMDGVDRVSGVILAAGLGTRLFPLTRFRAKPAVPFLGQPLIHYSMAALRDAGIESAVINLHYLPHTIREAVASFRGEGALRVDFSPERRILGTSGAVRQAARLLQGEELVILNGKIYSELDLSRVLDAHREQDALVTLVVVPFPPGATFNPVRVSPQGGVLGFGPGSQGTPRVFTGIQIWSHRVLQHLPAGVSDSVKDLYPRLIERGERVCAYLSDSYWCECSTPRRYWRRSLEAMQRMGRTGLGDVANSSGRNVICGSDVEIGTGSQVEDTIIWEDVHIQQECLIRDAIICAGVRLPHGTRLDNVIVTPPFDWTGSVGAGEPQVERDFLIWPLDS